MRYAVLGTGMVGQTIASKLAALGHEVRMGARQAGNDKATAWAAAAGAPASQGSFAEAAQFGEVVVNATSGEASLAALSAAGAGNLSGKIVIDIANPIAANSGMPPALSVCNTDSLGEQIQRAFPDARVVKTLNTMSANVMVEPGLVPGAHTVFVCGDDASAKASVAELLKSFGWPAASVLDLGPIGAARGTEMYLALWLRMWGAVGSGNFNINVVKG